MTDRALVRERDAFAAETAGDHLLGGSSKNVSTRCLRDRLLAAVTRAGGGA